MPLSSIPRKTVPGVECRQTADMTVLRLGEGRMIPSPQHSVCYTPHCVIVIKGGLVCAPTIFSLTIIQYKETQQTRMHAWRKVYGVIIRPPF